MQFYFRNDINNGSSSYQQDSHLAPGLGGSEIEAAYNPYLHGPSKGEYVKAQILDQIPTAIIIQPELIKVETVPLKKVYDFTKRSKNMKLVEEGIFDKFDHEERCDSKIKPEDLKKLEIELKKK